MFSVKLRQAHVPRLTLVEVFFIAMKSFCLSMISKSVYLKIKNSEDKNVGIGRKISCFSTLVLLAVSHTIRAFYSQTMRICPQGEAFI
jgi:hypothetical protein